MKTTYFFKQLILGTAILLTTMVSFADSSVKIKDALASIGLQQVELVKSPIEGYQMVLTEAGTLFVSNDGKYLLKGPLLAIEKGKVINATSKLLMDRLNNLVNSMIIYKAPQEKYVVNVFTDISCSFCHKLHEAIPEYNAKGITIRYLAFPRSGVNSDSGHRMQKIWCSADRAKAFDSNEDIPTNSLCGPKLVQEQFNLGVQFGVNGTPALVFSDGSLIPGYLPPSELLKELEKRFPQ